MKKHLFTICILLLFLLSGTIYPIMGDGTAIDDIVAELESLSFDQFVEESYKQMLLRDPETVTALGLSDEYGMRNDQLTNISDEYIRETQSLEVAVLDLLRQYDRDSLTAEQQLSYDIYDWYLDDIVRGHEFRYHNYSVSQFMTSTDQSLIYLFTEIQPVSNKQDAEDYIARLSQVDIKFDQLLEGLAIREEMGIIPPQYIIQWTQYNVGNAIQGGTRRTPFYSTFRDKVNAIDDLSGDEITSLLADAEAAIDESVIPAYRLLLSYLGYLEMKATNDLGAWKFPDGDQYYNYMLRHLTTTEMTADEIHELGLREVARVQGEIYEVLGELGYPEDVSMSQAFARIAREGGTYSGDNIFVEYESIIFAADIRLGEVFDIRPQAPVIVIPDPGGGGYYEPPALDGSRPGAFYAAQGGQQPRYNMASLTYHEAIPGHHFQIALAQETGLPLFRRNSPFTAYVEGWALYAERLAWEIDLYEGDPYGNLGRLQFELLRAVRLVVDTGIHAKGWTYDEAISYMMETNGYSEGSAQYRISRYIAWPGQATAYMIGMLEILELRQSAMDELGDQYDIKEFHNVVLTSGAVPLDILGLIVQDYIDEKLGE